MPMYEYECGSCGHHFEVIQKFSDKPVKKCPHCGKTGKVKRLVSSPAIQFKGTGWYVTDYGKGTTHAKSGSKDKKDAGGDTAPAKTEKTEKAKDSTPAPPATSNTK